MLSKAFPATRLRCVGIAFEMRSKMHLKRAFVFAVVAPMPSRFPSSLVNSNRTQPSIARSVCCGCAQAMRTRQLDRLDGGTEDARGCVVVVRDKRREVPLAAQVRVLGVLQNKGRAKTDGASLVGASKVHAVYDVRSLVTVGMDFLQPGPGPARSRHQRKSWRPCA